MAEYRSKISDQFYYLTKMVENCDKCKKIIKYYCIINSLCAMYPDKAAEFVKRKNISVLDLFKHYHINLSQFLFNGNKLLDIN